MLLQIIAVCALGIAVLALGIASFSWFLHQKNGSTADISARVRKLDAELTDLTDQVGHWIRRQSVRNAREKRETVPTLEPSAGVGAVDRKAAIRARIAARNNTGALQ